jgi:hypothetical protein
LPQDERERHGPNEPCEKGCAGEAIDATDTNVFLFEEEGQTVMTRLRAYSAYTLPSFPAAPPRLIWTIGRAILFAAARMSPMKCTTLSFSSETNKTTTPMDPWSATQTPTPCAHHMDILMILRTMRCRTAAREMARQRDMTDARKKHPGAARKAGSGMTGERSGGSQRHAVSLLYFLHALTRTACCVP